ncbi:MAG: hypothetical protein M0R80_00610 [Proteobacteria bacterium]|jgi:hypothetical protein|nr:hypothetical protein [Pseudomonadota bacterium]
MLCELCENEDAYNFHHCIPRTLHGKKRIKKAYTKAELACGLHLCKTCHKTIHEFASEKELGERYNTKKKLLEHPQIRKYVKWKKTH